MPKNVNNKNDTDMLKPLDSVPATDNSPGVQEALCYPNDDQSDERSTCKRPHLLHQPRSKSRGCLCLMKQSAARKESMSGNFKIGVQSGCGRVPGIFSAHHRHVTGVVQVLVASQRNHPQLLCLRLPTTSPRLRTTEAVGASRCSLLSSLFSVEGSLVK